MKELMTAINRLIAVSWADNKFGPIQCVSADDWNIFVEEYHKATHPAVYTAFATWDVTPDASGNLVYGNNVAEPEAKK